MVTIPKCYLPKKQIRDSFNKASDSYDEVAMIQQRVADSLYSQFDLPSLAHQTILDLGAGTGYFTQLLLKKYRKRRIFALDIAEKMLSKINSRVNDADVVLVCADAEVLPFSQRSFDLIYSNLMLHWCNDIKHTLSNLKKILKPNGKFIFSTLGPQTLYELQTSWRTIDDSIHVHSFVTPCALKNSLQEAGFNKVDFKSEMIVLKYQHLASVLSSLKSSGTQNIHINRFKGLTGKLKFNTFIEEYERYRDKQGQLPLTYEVFYVNAGFD